MYVTLLFLVLCLVEGVLPQELVLVRDLVVPESRCLSIEWAVVVGLYMHEREKERERDAKKR
jgi:hypothetical protein